LAKTVTLAPGYVVVDLAIIRVGARDIRHPRLESRANPTQNRSAGLAHPSRSRRRRARPRDLEGRQGRVWKHAAIDLVTATYDRERPTTIYQGIGQCAPN